MDEHASQSIGEDSPAIASVVADWTSTSVGRMVKNEIEAVLKLGDTLNLLTSNVGSELIMNLCQDPDLMLNLTASPRRPGNLCSKPSPPPCSAGWWWCPTCP